MRYASADITGQPRLLVEHRPDRFVAVDRVEEAMPAGLRRAPVDVADLVKAGDDYRARLARALAAGAWEADEASLDELDLRPPVRQPGSIVCVGRNYLDHVSEGAVDVPAFPVLFSKFPNTLLGSGATVPEHEIARQLDYEGELALVIGRRASRLSTDEAMSCVAGYTAMNDISARDLQEGDLQWIRGKSLDGYAPCGPTFVTADEIDDVGSIRIVTRVNGEVRQDAHASDMIFDIPHLLAFITQAITLQPGDIVATGTPAGTAIGFDPPPFLTTGDRVEVELTHIGCLTSHIGDSRC